MTDAPERDVPADVADIVAAMDELLPRLTDEQYRLLAIQAAGALYRLQQMMRDRA